MSYKWDNEYHTYEFRGLYVPPLGGGMSGNAALCSINYIDWHYYTKDTMALMFQPSIDIKNQYDDKFIDGGDQLLRQSL